MNYKYLKVEEEGVLAVVRLYRHEKKNALSTDLIEELLVLAGEFDQRSDITTIILTGSNGFFSAGVDLTDPKIYEIFSAPISARRKMIDFGPKMCKAWESLDQITIGAIEGFCIGGGVSLVSSLDFRVMAESSYIRVPEISLGMNMSWATLPRLVHLVGPARAKEIVIFAERVYGKDAYDWGFAQRLCPDGKAINEAKKIAGKVSKMPPVPVMMTKQTINALTTALDRTASYMDTDQYILSIMTEDFKEGVAAFMEKRDPKFKGE
ncbi:MAG: enoyl-CoA hydratase/isomerase family protein [Deltaproteobacteria bacterium]|uniref:Enoyl-CoA hydratase/isomerase family protein n=1 Tax=Candidatus Zymogenus saltonus TaxID=2844893 RepID=A0A9D8PLM9_9DELT|nr:enoyl-CoA hydratase/isomerase family protein [Candidatus Zymogenus saltonus]